MSSLAWVSCVTTRRFCPFCQSPSSFSIVAISPLEPLSTLLFFSVTCTLIFDRRFHDTELNTESLFSRWSRKLATLRFHAPCPDSVWQIFRSSDFQTLAMNVISSSLAYTLPTLPWGSSFATHILCLIHLLLSLPVYESAGSATNKLIGRRYSGLSRQIGTKRTVERRGAISGVYISHIVNIFVVVT